MSNNYIIPNGTDYLRRPRETSPLLPLRDPTAQNQMWKMVEKLGKRVANLTNLLQQVNARVARAERWGTVPVSFPSHPFKIYQPNNVASFIGQTAPMFTNASNGIPVNCTIVASGIPTNLAAMPPVVSVDDSWRFWSIRSGLVEIRTIYNQLADTVVSGIAGMETDDFIFGSNNWGYKYCPIENTDGVAPMPYFVSSPGEFDEQIENSNAPPIVIGVNQDPNYGAALSLWLEFISDTATLFPSVSIQGQAYQPTGGGDFAWPPAGQNRIPIGAILPVPEQINTSYVFQMLFDHVSNRFGTGTGNFSGNSSSGSGQSTIENFRGLVVSSGVIGPAGATCFPADLSTQLFYPGDVVELIFYGTVDYGGQYAPSWARMKFTGPTPAFINFADFGVVDLDIDSFDAQSPPPDYTVQGFDSNWTVLDIAPDAGSVWDYIYPPGPPP